MTLLIGDADVENLLSFEETIEAVEDAYRQYGLGLAGGNSLIHGDPVVPRCEMRVEGKNLPHMSPQVRSVNQSMAYLEQTGMVLLRFSYHLGNRKGLVEHLIDARSGEVLAIIRGTFGWWMRVGSEGAIGARYLGRKDSRTVGVIGTGQVGRAQLQAISRVVKVESVFVYAGRTSDHDIACQYAREMGDKLGIEILVSDGPEKVVESADILVTATRSTDPIVRGEWVRPGLHINAIGADDPFKAELDGSALKKADKLVIDYELALDTKEIRLPMEQGILSRRNVYANIGQVVAGVKSGREKPSEITIFKSTGMTLPYVAIYAEIYRKAKALGLGTEIDEKCMDLVYYQGEL